METVRQPQLFGLFERAGNRWLRLYPGLAVCERRAAQIFRIELQDRRRELRPIGHPDRRS
jgi:hypothetical protein